MLFEVLRVYSRRPLIVLKRKFSFYCRSLPTSLTISLVGSNAFAMSDTDLVTQLRPSRLSRLR